MSMLSVTVMMLSVMVESVMELKEEVLDMPGWPRCGRGLRRRCRRCTRDTEVLPVGGAGWGRWGDGQSRH